MQSKYLTFQGAILRNITFTTTVFKEGELYVAYTPELDVSSAGHTPAEAKKNLLEAVRGFLLTAAEKGTLEQILEEAGFIKKDNESVVPPKHISTDLVSLQV